MAIRIEENDYGTKPATRKKCDELVQENPAKFKKMMQAYWLKVYENAVMAITEMGAVDTGALRQSIRLEFNKTIVPGLSSTSMHEVARTDDEQTAYIIAGGGGVINPNKNKEVDYAQAVHDGYFLNRASKIQFKLINQRRKKSGLRKLKPSRLPEALGGQTGGWKAGRPFLDEAVKRTEPYLAQLVKEFMDGIEHQWMEDQPLVGPFSVSMIVKKTR